MNDISITLASKEDLPAILHLQKEAYLSEAAIYNDFTIPPLQQTIEQLEEEFINHIVLKAETQGEIIGSVRASEKQGICFIGRLIVDNKAQNQGLGTQLLKAIESRFHNVSTFELFTGHRSLKNLYLYQKQGYTISGNQEINDSLTIVTLHKNNT